MEHSHLHYPKLRSPIELRLEDINGNQVLLIRCPLGISPEPLGLIPNVVPIIQLFNGENSIDQIVEKFSEQGATNEIVLQLAELLDNALFLDGPNFQNTKKGIEKSYLDSPIRPPALAGLSYNGTKEELGSEVDSYLSYGEKVKDLLGELEQKEISCLMTPHIDYHRGAKCYGRTFSALKGQSPDVVILIGTSHQFSTHLFHLTPKDFECPLGTMSNMKSFTQRLADSYGKERAYGDEILHKQEHSLELQLPFIARLLPDAEIVPILVGSFHEMVLNNQLPNRVESYERFIEALLETIEKEVVAASKTFLVLAGVDMAHVGRYFGDEGSLSPDFMQQIREKDEAYLDCLDKRSPEELFSHIESDKDARRICGFPTMYTVLDLFNRMNMKTEQHLIDYRQAVNMQTDCAVTFGGMAFCR